MLVIQFNDLLVGAATALPKAGISCVFQQEERSAMIAAFGYELKVYGHFHKSVPFRHAPFGPGEGSAHPEKGSHRDADHHMATIRQLADDAHRRLAGTRSVGDPGEEDALFDVDDFLYVLAFERGVFVYVQDDLNSLHFHLVARDTARVQALTASLASVTGVSGMGC